MKSVVITLTTDILDAELNKDVTVTVGTNTYTGKIAAIISHQQLPTATKLTLEAVGLKTS